MAGSAGTEDGDMGFQIAPMVDVVFVLMVFFMAMSGLQMREKELPIALPGPVDTSRPQILLIDISADGDVTMNSERVGSTGDRSLIGLRESLKAIIEQSGDKDPVVIRPSSLTRHERIIDVLSAVKAAGVKKISFS